MSVYIKIKDVTFAQQTEQQKQLAVIIKSEDTALQTHPVTSSLKTIWNSSLVATIKEKKLTFEIAQVKDHSKFEVLSSCELYFSSIRSNPDKQTSQSLTLDGQGMLNLDIFYNSGKGFVGPITFYEYEAQLQDITNVLEETTAKDKTLNTQAPEITKTDIIKNKGFFTCCGNDFDDRKFQVEDDQRKPQGTTQKFPNELNNQFTGTQQNKAIPQKIQFYKGPCQTKNLFSVCDAGVEDQKFTVVEDYYRDKN